MNTSILHKIALERSKKGYEWIKENMGQEAIQKLPGSQMESTKDCMLCRIFNTDDFAKAVYNSGLNRDELRELGFTFGWEFMRGDKDSVLKNIAMYQACWDEVINNGND